MENSSLQSRIQAVRVRLIAIGAATAGCWGLALAVGVALVGVWLDLVWDLPAAIRIAALALAGIAGVALAVGMAASALLAAQASDVARRLDRAARRGGDILTGWELAVALASTGRLSQCPSPEPEITDHLAQMAVVRAASLAEQASMAEAAPIRPLHRSLWGLGLLAVLVLGLVVGLPGLAKTEWNRFRKPYDDVPPFSTIRFEVEPGDAEVVYGGDLDISATVSGATVDQVELVLLRKDLPNETLPLFRQQDGRWRTVLSRITASGEYYLQSGAARTARYSIRVITVPRIEDVRVTIIPPAYTRRARYEGPLPREGVAGLPGAEVLFHARSNRPLSGGVLKVVGGRAVEPTEPSGDATPVGPIDIAMRPEADDSEMKTVVGRFWIVGDGKFELRVTDDADQTSQEAFAGTITRLCDERPFARLLQPRTMSFATPTIVLPIEIEAEDDYGISRVQLYRALNDSRPLPVDMPLESRSNLVNEMTALPLASYGLEPGDILKLFVRVEDNDPAGAKGAESAVVTVQIISQEEFQRMLEVREGIEVLMSKYDAAKRRVESLADKLDKIQKEIDALPPGDQQEKALRDKMKQTLDQFREESRALEKLSQNRLPVDLDENLSPEIGKMAKMTDEMADELEKLMKESTLNREQIQRQLKKMAKRLNQQREEYNKEVSEPLDQLSVVFPLMVDQQRFVMLVLRQDDLTERLASLKDRNGQDDPALKARMRDLEEEQLQIRSDLEQLLADIEEHVDRLPNDPEFDELRGTAIEFVDNLRDTGVEQVMAEAENGLADFSGSTGYEKAKEADDILHEFLKKCESNGGMSQCAGNCLRFQPKLCQGMGNSIPQLMAMMGMGNGAGSGGGTGMGAGFSAQRGGYGLYGGMPGMGEAFGNAGHGRASNSQGPRGKGRFSSGRNRDDNDRLLDELQTDDASGVNLESVPLQSRRRVGQYFQRINEETADPSDRPNDSRSND